MKVLLVNGSSRSNGCTDAALNEVARALEEEGIETEKIFIGNEALPDCIACRKCKETGRCILPIPAAGLSARRAGTTASFDVINKYFTIRSMPVVSSTYWNHVYGSQPEDVAEDKEGLMTMYNIGKNDE